MEGQSGMFKAGTILLLVGAILAGVGALFLIVFGLVFGAVLADLEGSDFPAGLFGLLYVGIGIVVAIGAVFGFVAWNKANSGDAHGGFVFGLVAALVPPVQVLPLLGCIFCKVSPEGEQRPGNMPRPPA